MSDRLCIAIVHFQFRYGGVTRVVESAVRALADQDVDIAVLGGESTESEVLTPFAEVVSGLSYSSEYCEAGVDALRKNLEQAAIRRFGRLPDLWHVHNHSLGKNLNLISVLKSFSSLGQNLLLQIHDFAEDGRPRNYQLLRDSGLVDALYPAAHYATLNGRDRAVLAAAGCNEIHDLPNPVNAISVKQVPLKTPPARIIYLTRAIRRKNLGELVLWSALSDGKMRFATSLAPENPAEQERYQQWERFAEEHELPLDLNYGGRNKLSLEALMGEADALITTSVAEGFGLSFLEPWLAGRPVLGRDLPEITSDFKTAGVDLSHLYDILPVRTEAFDWKAFQTRYENQWIEYCSAYGSVPESLTSEVRPDTFDFGCLDETAQREVLITLLQQREEVTQSSLLIPHSDIIAENRIAVSDTYNLAQYGRRLMRTYCEVVNEPADVTLSATQVLHEFMDIKRFNMLRT